MNTINLTKLYPTVTLESILNDSIAFFIDKLKKNETIVPIMTYNYNGNYYIIDGHHRMLAANICEKDKIDIIELER